jgi:predicted deacylase
MGVGMRITPEYGQRLTDGILNLLRVVGVWQGEVPKVTCPALSAEGGLCFVSADTSGVFLPGIRLGATVKKGEHLGNIISPSLGRVEQRVTAPCGGKVFTLREYPIVYQGALLARILEEKPHEE